MRGQGEKARSLLDRFPKSRPRNPCRRLTGPTPGELSARRCWGFQSHVILGWSRFCGHALRIWSKSCQPFI